MRKLTERRERENFTIIMVITMGFSGVLGFLGLNPLHVGRDSLFIQVVSVLIRPHNSTLFEHLTII